MDTQTDMQDEGPGEPQTVAEGWSELAAGMQGADDATRLVLRDMFYLGALFSLKEAWNALERNDPAALERLMEEVLVGTAEIQERRSKTCPDGVTKH